MTLPKGTYLLTLKQYATTADVESFEVQKHTESGWSPCYTIGEETNLVSQQEKVFYVLIEAEDGQEERFRLYVHYQGAVSGEYQTKVELEPMIKLKENTGYYANPDIGDRLRELDYKNIFDYAHQVDENIAIDNPLDSNKFFDANHFYNQFVIPQIQTVVCYNLRE